MSTSTSAIVFWGFTFPREQRTDEVEYSRDRHVKIGIFGDDYEITDYVCVKASELEAEIQTYQRIKSFDVGEEWESNLRAFCDRYGITWPEDGPGWHVAPLRI